MDENKNVNASVENPEAAPEKKHTDKRASAPVRLAVAISAVVVAIVLVFNIFWRMLPTNVLEYDISGNKLYDVSQTSKDFLNELEHDIEIIVIQDNTSMDDRLVKFLDRYEALSDRVSVTYIDPVEHPSVLDTYETKEETIVVSCADTDKKTIININGFDTYEESIFGYDYMYYYYYDTYSLSTFDADGQLTSAINSVISEESNMVYYLAGHGESEMNATLEASIYKAGCKTASVNLLKDGGIPADCDMLVINIPTTDLANDEYDMIIEYMNGGGKAMLVIDDKTLPNFNLLLADYGLQINDGYLGDKSSYYTAYSSYYGYYCIAPELSTESAITADIKQDALILYARGMSRITANHSNVSVETFMTSTTSGMCYYDETNNKEGQFIIGAVATETLENGGTARMTVISAQYIADDELTGSTANMSNLDIMLNAVTANFGDISSALNIPSKSVTLSYNNAINTPVWNALFIVLIPLAFIVVGLICWNSRRKR